jgi:hypothetical protein
MHSHFILLPSLPMWHMPRIFFNYKTKLNCSIYSSKNLNLPASPDSPLTAPSLSLSLSLSPAINALSLCLRQPHTPFISLRQNSHSLSLRMNPRSLSEHSSCSDGGPAARLQPPRSLSPITARLSFGSLSLLLV